MAVLGAFWHSPDKRQRFRGGRVYNETRWWGYNDTHVASDRWWFRRGAKKKKKQHRTESLTTRYPSMQRVLARLACAFLLIGLIWGKMHCHYSYPALDRLKRDREKGERGVCGVVAREWNRDMQKGRAVSLRNEPDKRKGLGRWAEETVSTLLN